MTNKEPIAESMLSMSFINSFRSDNDELKNLSPPSGFAFTPQGHLVISDDFNHRIQIYDDDRLLKSFGEKGKGNGQFHYPKGITIDKNGSIYVADSWNHRVQKFDSEGNHQQNFGSCGEAQGELNEPYDIMVATSGNILVVERYNHRLQWFSPEGKSLGWVGQRGTVLEENLAYFYETSANLFSAPAFEFPTSISTDSRGNFFITDSGNHRIVKFDKNWKRIFSFGERGDAAGQFQYPLCISVGGNDFLYVSDLNNNRIQIFSPFGQFLDKLDQVDSSTPLQAPSLTAIDTHGKLNIGLTFNPRIFLFSTSSKSLESVANKRCLSDPKNPEWPTLMGQLAEQSSEYSKAKESYSKAIQLILPGKNSAQQKKPSDPNLLLNLSRITLKTHDSSESETALLNGLAVFVQEIKSSREEVLETYTAWEEVARKFDNKEFKRRLDILQDQEDLRVFDHELFNLEQKHKVLFRKVRAVSYKHCQLSDQLAEYISNIISSQCLSSSLILPACENLIERLKEIGEVFFDKLAIKEVNEIALVNAFSELQEDQTKWNIFRGNFLANNRITLIFRPLLFELRTLLLTFKCCVQTSTENQKMAGIFDQIVGDPLCNEIIPKVLLGIQEIQPAHVIIDTLWRDLIDTYITHLKNEKEPLIRELGPDYFSPLPFDVEDLNIKEIVKSYNIENTEIKRTSSLLIIGNDAYPIESLPDDFTQKISQILESQANYKKKNQELQKQLNDLDRQQRNLNQQLKQVNPQDKQAPISISNNICIVDFQIGLIRRMILTLEVNESHNINRLIIGAALVSTTSPQDSPIQNFYKKLDVYSSQERIAADSIAEEIKNFTFQLSHLKNQQLNLRLEKNISNIDRSIQLDEEIQEIQNNLDSLEFNLIRRARTCNRLERLFVFFKQTGIYEKERTIFDLVPTFSHSLTRMGSAIGTIIQPMGLAFDSNGNLFCVDQENHHVFHISKTGVPLTRFGGWGNSPGNFKYPVSVQIDRQDNIYVVDMNNQRVQKFSPDGDFLLTFGDHEEEDQRLGKMAFSSSIDKEDNLWVTDASHQRIQVYGPDGKLIQSVIPEGIEQPIGICSLENGEYLIADRSADLVKHYDLNGTLLANLRREGTGFGDLYIITYSPTYGIFASDHWSSRILHLDFALNIKGIYGSPGRRVGQFNRVGYMDTRDNLLAVSDTGNNRIQVFDIKKTLSS